MRRFIVGALAAALLVMGCADEGDDDVSGDGSPGARDTAAADQEAADGAVAAVEETLRDDGFAPVPDEDDEGDLEFRSEECRELDEGFIASDEDLPGETASAESPDYEGGELTASGGVQESVQAVAGFVEEPDDLDDVVEFLGDERLGPCLEEAFRAALEESAAEDDQALELGEIAVEQLADDGPGDTAGGIEMRGEVSAGGFTFPFTVAVEFAQVERALVGVVTSSVGPDEQQVDRAALLQTLVDGVSDQAG
jgi:hypothetical protein